MSQRLTCEPTPVSDAEILQRYAPASDARQPNEETGEEPLGFPVGRGSGGSLQYRGTYFYPTSHPVVRTLSDRGSSRSPDTTTGNSVSPLRKRVASEQFNDYLVRRCMQSSRSPSPRGYTAGKKLPQLQVLGSKLEQYLSEETQPTTGTLLKIMREEETWTQSQVTFTYAITGLSHSSLQTMLNLLEWKRKYGFSMDQRVLENQDEHGKKLDPVLMVRILGPNGGTATGIRGMLLSMNFGEVLTSATFYAGSTVIQSQWKLKVVRVPWSVTPSGLLRTCIPDSGIPNSTPKLTWRWKEE